MIEQSAHARRDNTIQKPKKKRSQVDKIGRIKYTLQLLKEIREEMADIKFMQRTIFSGLKGFFNFQKPFIEKVACQDEVDVAILQLLYEKGEGGVLPKDIAYMLSGYQVKRHQISRRLLRMNKRLMKEIGQHVVEKRGWKWALTSFTYNIWGIAEGELTSVSVKDLIDKE